MSLVLSVMHLLIQNGETIEITVNITTVASNLVTENAATAQRSWLVRSQPLLIPIGWRPRSDAALTYTTFLTNQRMLVSEQLVGRAGRRHHLHISRA